MSIRNTRPAYVWDYDIDESKFNRLLRGELKIGRLDRNWAEVRLSFEVRLLPEDGRCNIDCRIGREWEGRIVVDNYGVFNHDLVLPRQVRQGSRRLRLSADSLPTEALRVKEMQPLSDWS